MRTWINKYISNEDLKKIQEKIAEVEKTTSGEIRVHFRRNSSFRERRLSMHEIALKDFHKLGMHKTKDKTGVLIFILFKQRYFDIIADSGIYEKIPKTIWNDIEAKTKHEFRHGNYAVQIFDLLSIAGEALAREFPKESDDTNELPDDVVVS